MSSARRLTRAGNRSHLIKHKQIRTEIELLEPRLLLAAQPYTWQNAAIGAGGFVDGVFYSPTQQNVIYARTDIGGLYKSVNDGQSWQELLDFVGNNTAASGNGTQSQEIGVLSFAIDPENPNKLYADVGQYSGTNGAVFYSTDAGQTWNITNLTFYVGGNSNGRGDGEQIQVDPNDSNIIFLGSNDSGLWKSTDAGHTFTQVSTFAPTSTTFVLFDKSSATPAHPSQTIYVGANSTAAGTNLYETTNGGTTWTEVVGTGAPPTGWLPGHAVLSGGNLYLGYANDEAPNGSITAGGVFSYVPGTGVWTDISPVVPTGNFGYDAVAIDPEAPNTLVVTSFDFYSGPDSIWRTTDANSATPTWTELYDPSSAQNNGFGGFDTTRNTSNAPWIAAFGDGIGNWAGTVAINPFNSDQLMYGTGQGLWATNNASNGGANTMLTAANSWYFPDDGIEFTAALQLAAPPAGVPLFSALGDINGFAHTTFTSSPAGGGIAGAITGGGLGTINSVDFAEDNPNIEAVVGQAGTRRGAYTLNDGTTWTEFASRPPGAFGGSIAVSADGSIMIWAASGKLPYYSINDGTTWTQSTLPAGTLTGGTMVADRVTSTDFYYWTENVNDNSCTLYVSGDGGQTFNPTAAGALGIGNVTLVADPHITGGFWLSSYIGIYHSTDFGNTITQNSTIGFANVPSIALGAPAPGSTTAAIYIYGTIGSFEGVYRSDDGGATWVQLNDVSHQWGGLVDTMAADPNVFGRVYLGINGRGIIIGNPTGSLPAGWTDTDINTPGNPGFATTTTNLSTGASINQWTLDGGGAGLSGTADQLNFASQSISGSTVISAQLTGMTNADPNTALPEAGVMVRAGTAAGDPFAAMVQTPDDVLFEYRTTAGGAEVSQLFGVTPGYLKIIRNGNNFSGFYSSDGTTWTQLGSTITIAAMPTIANVGLIATAAYNPQLTQATFANVNVAGLPVVATAAAATPNPVPASSTNLSVLGSEISGTSTLTYTWSSTGPAPVAYTGTTNGTNAAQNITANFTKAGSYNFTATITDQNGFTVSSNVAVTVNVLPASQLAIVEQPLIAAPGATVIAPVIVAVEDARGSIVTADNSLVTLQLNTGPAGGTLTGTTTATAVNGLAVFNNITLSPLGNYSLSASAAGLTTTTTQAIEVTPVTVSPYLFSGIPLSAPAQAFAERRTLQRNSQSAVYVAPQLTSPSIQFLSAPAFTATPTANPSFAASSAIAGTQNNPLDPTNKDVAGADKAVLSKT
jgi:hypothetical protein